MDGSNPFEAIVQAIKALPPSVNPYVALQETILHILAVPLPEWYTISLILASALNGVLIIVTIIGLVGYAASPRPLWLYRLRATTYGRGRLVVPNVTVLYLVYGCLIGILMQVSVWRAYATIRDHETTRSQLPPQGVMFWTLFMALWTEAHALACACASQFRVPPWAINLYFVGMQLVMTIGLFAPFGLAMIALTQAWDYYATFADSISAAGADWVSNAALRVDPSWASEVLSSLLAMESFGGRLRDFFIVFVAAMALCAITFVPLAVVHLGRLRRDVAAAVQLLRQSRKLQRLLGQGDEQETTDEEAALSRTWRVLVAETIAVAVACLVVLVLHIYLLIRLDTLETLVGNGTSLAIIWTVIYVALALVTLPIASLVTWRVCQPLFSRRPSRRCPLTSAASGVSISIEEHVDVADEYAFDLSTVLRPQRRRFDEDDGERKLVTPVTLKQIEEGSKTPASAYVEHCHW